MVVFFICFIFSPFSVIFCSIFNMDIILYNIFYKSDMDIILYKSEFDLIWRRYQEILFENISTFINRTIFI
ncbi:MAG: hypothetical protein DRH12_11925 [Deltaproteobacteria bacterium]|nr:MAG: hypothetical protein DRH12_11925 [Deltaproteobacteria bacterium]